jgi:hypothetical protein
MSKLREQLIEAHMDRCIHFRGIQHALCAANVNIRELTGGDNLGWATRMPCFLKNGSVVSCQSLKVLTREAAEAAAIKDEERSVVMMRCFTAAHADAKAKGIKKGNGGRSSMPCPAECGGTLHYSVASYNGHMHAKCDTGNCVSWME